MVSLCQFLIDFEVFCSSFINRHGSLNNPMWHLSHFGSYRLGSSLSSSFRGDGADIINSREAFVA